MPETTTKKRQYGKLNEQVFLEAIGQGMTKTEAGRKAGLKAKNDSAIIHTVNKKLSNNEPLKRSVTQQYEALEQRLLRAIEAKDLSKAQVNQLIIAMAVTRDKIQLLRGDATQNIATLPQIVIRKIEKPSQTKTDNTYKATQ